jgi:hypothetical protein
MAANVGEVFVGTPASASVIRAPHMNTWWERSAGFSSVFLRVALPLSFLSAVADRFGWWGAFGLPNGSWGDFARFVGYTGQLNWFLPHAAIPAVAVLATGAEICSVCFSSLAGRRGSPQWVAEFS